MPTGIGYGSFNPKCAGVRAVEIKKRWREVEREMRAAQRKAKLRDEIIGYLKDSHDPAERAKAKQARVELKQLNDEIESLRSELHNLEREALTLDW